MAKVEEETKIKEWFLKHCSCCAEDLTKYKQGKLQVRVSIEHLGEIQAWCCPNCVKNILKEFTI